MSADKTTRADPLAEWLDGYRFRKPADILRAVQAAAELRHIPALEAERDKLRESLEYRREKQAQREQRLWQWAHEELSEPLKTRYFNIVANGTADVMEQPTYAQQFNMMRHRAEAAEAERDQLRAEVEALRADAECFRFWVSEAARSPARMAALIANCTTEEDYRAAILPCVWAAQSVIDAARKQQ